MISPFRTHPPLCRPDPAVCYVPCHVHPLPVSFACLVNTRSLIAVPQGYCSIRFRALLLLCRLEPVEIHRESRRRSTSTFSDPPSELRSTNWFILRQNRAVLPLEKRGALPRRRCSRFSAGACRFRSSTSSAWRPTIRSKATILALCSRCRSPHAPGHPP